MKGILVTLNFDLITAKVEHFMPLPHGPLVQIFSKIGLFLFKISRLQVWQRTNECKDD